MCTRLILSFGEERTLDIESRYAHKVWADEKLRQGHEEWEAVKSLPFNGFRRAENLEKTAREAVHMRDKMGNVVLRDGKPVTVKFFVPVKGYWEENGGMAQYVRQSGFAEFRLHSCWNPRDRVWRKGWVLITTAAKHQNALQDKRGNARVPRLKQAGEARATKPQKKVAEQAGLPF